MHPGWTYILPPTQIEQFQQAEKELAPVRNVFNASSLDPVSNALPEQKSESKLIIFSVMLVILLISIIDESNRP